MRERLDIGDRGGGGPPFGVRNTVHHGRHMASTTIPRLLVAGFAGAGNAHVCGLLEGELRVYARWEDD